jgi:hypothetical protein
MVDRQELVRDQVIAGAKSVPQLVEAAKVADPDLFAALKGMPAARLYAPPATAIIAWLAGRYGLDWPPDVCSAIALFLVSVGAGARCGQNRAGSVAIGRKAKAGSGR